MTTRDKMKIFSGATAVLFIITGIVLGIVTFMLYKSDKGILDNTEYAICTISDIVKENGERVVKGNYLAYDDSWSIDLSSKQVSSDAVVGDSFKVYFEKGKPESVFTEYLIANTRKMITILFILAFASVLFGICEMYFLVLRWDVIYPLPEKKVKRVKRVTPQNTSRQVRQTSVYDEDLDLWGDDVTPAYNSNSQNNNRYGQSTYQPRGREFSYSSYGVVGQGNADFSQSGLYGDERNATYKTTPNESYGTYHKRPTNKNKNKG